MYGLKHTFGPVCKGLPANNALLLVLDNFEALSVERLLELGQVDVYVWCL